MEGVNRKTHYIFSDLFDRKAFIPKGDDNPQSEIYEKIERGEFTAILMEELKSGYLLAFVELITIIQSKLKIYGITFMTESNAAVIFASRTLSIKEQLDIQCCIYERTKEAFYKVEKAQSREIEIEINFPQ